jgi:hypothetical protein
MNSNIDVVEILKMASVIIPGVWYLSTSFKGLGGKIDVLETRLESKIDNRVSLLDQKIDSKISLIELQIKQYADSEQSYRGKLENMDTALRRLSKRVDHLENKKED